MLEIRPLENDDYDSWLPLWLGNNQGHFDQEVTDETWKRLMAANSNVNGLGAFNDDKMTGLLHYILHPVTGHINPVCYMQDVFVDQRYRRMGAAKALVKELSLIGKNEKWARIYWLAEENNEAAQNLYKNIGVKLNFSLHVMPLTD